MPNTCRTFRLICESGCYPIQVRIVRPGNRSSGWRSGLRYHVLLRYRNPGLRQEGWVRCEKYEAKDRAEIIRPEQDRAEQERAEQLGDEQKDNSQTGAVQFWGIDRASTGHAFTQAPFSSSVPYCKVQVRTSARAEPVPGTSKHRNTGCVESRPTELRTSHSP